MLREKDIIFRNCTSGLKTVITLPFDGLDENKKDGSEKKSPEYYHYCCSVNGRDITTPE